MSLMPQSITALAETDVIGSGKNIVAGASVSITKAGGGSATIYSDAAGTSVITLPTVTDSSGELLFYIESGSYIYTIAGSPYPVFVSDKNHPVIIDTWADIATVTPTAAGQLFTLKQHTSGGLGGGTLMAFVGSVTDDGGIQKNALGGYYLKRINFIDYDVENFGALPYPADNYAAITAAIAAAKAAAGGDVMLPSGVCNTSQPIVIDGSGVRLMGKGFDMNHDGGTTVGAKTTLSYVGAVTAESVVTLKTPLLATSSKFANMGAENFNIECNLIAAGGLNLLSVFGSNVRKMSVRNATYTHYQVTNYVAGSLAEACDTQQCLFEQCYFTAGANSAHGFILSSNAPGVAGANTSLNTFRNCAGRVFTGVGFKLDDADNNLFFQCGAYVVSTGYGLEINGSGACDGNHFFNFSSGGVGKLRIRGTASGFAFNPSRNSFYMVDNLNGTQYPTVDAGCTLFWVSDLGVLEQAKILGALISRTITQAYSGERKSYATAHILDADNPCIVLEDQSHGVGYLSQLGGQTNLCAETNGALSYGASFATGPVGGKTDAVFWDSSGIEVRLTSLDTPDTNSNMTFSLTSNTQLTIRVKGTDGTVRLANITLA